MYRLVGFVLLWLCMAAVPAIAGTVYKCVDAHGNVSYQDTPCPKGERQQRVMQFSRSLAAPVSVSGASTAATAELPASAPAPSPSPPVASAPPPVLYRCTRATDGSTWLSRSGRTRPYLVPTAMAGRIQRSLADTYGSQQGKSVGMSAPELMPSPTPQMIGGRYYVRVQDQCRRLPPQAACAALRKQDEANEEAIRKAFKSDRAPLLKKRQELHAQMAGCRG